HVRRAHRFGLSEGLRTAARRRPEPVGSAGIRRSLHRSRGCLAATSRSARRSSPATSWTTGTALTRGRRFDPGNKAPAIVVIGTTGGVGAQSARPLVPSTGPHGVLSPWDERRDPCIVVIC